jgi:catechol-2,3-dioxygenase
VEFLRLRLRARRPAELREFYSKVLELPVADDAGGALSVRAGTTELLFVPGEPDGSGANPFYHFAFNIPENKLASSMAWMKGRAELIPSPATGRPVFDYPSWNAHSIYFYDPAGNILEFIARHNLQNAAAGGFDWRDILSASEIGLVVPEVSAAIAALKGKLGIADYIGVSETFAPIGNEHGLFIVAHADRKWFGRIPPGIFPAEVRMRGGVAGTHAIPEGAMQIEVV